MYTQIHDKWNTLLNEMWPKYVETNNVKSHDQFLGEVTFENHPVFSKLYHTIDDEPPSND